MKSKKFNSHEVQAIIAGNKTMFREVCKVQPKEHPNYVKSESITGKGYYFPFGKWKFEVGQEIFVKGQEPPVALKIKSVKVEKLQDINEEDAIAEGIEEVVIPIFKHLKPYTKSWKWYKEDNFATYCAKKSFGNFWNLTHKKQEHEWEANPWVFAYEFEVINFNK